MLDALQRDHLQSKKLAEACQSLQHSQLGNAEKFLRAARLESLHADVRGQACYSLAKVLESRASVARRLQAGADEQMLKRLTELHGKEWTRKWTGQIAAFGRLDAPSAGSWVVPRRWRTTARPAVRSRCCA